MTATVFSNDMVAHVWAQQRQYSGRSNNGNFYFEGPTIYSYGGHFPAGVFAKDGTVFVTTDGYSVTTNGKHMPAVRAAVRHRDPVYLPALDEIADGIRRADERGRLPSDWAKRVESYLVKNWAALPDDSRAAAWLLRAIGSRRTWAAMRAKLDSAAKAKARKNAAALKAQLVRAARETAARPWPIVRATAWGQANSFGQRDLRSDIADMRAERLATPKAHKRVRAVLWQREQALRSILARAVADADRHGNPGQRTKARAALGKLRRFKAGAIGYVPGYDGPDGIARRDAALELESGAGYRALADMLRTAADYPMNMPRSLRIKAQSIREAADAIATAREGEEWQRQEIRSARQSVRNGLQTFNRGRRHYRQLVASGTWESGFHPESIDGAAMNDRQRLRVLDSILSHVPAAVPWNADRGFELCPPLAARAAAIHAAASAYAADLEPIRVQLLSAAERAAEAARKAEREQAERIARMSPAERLEAWERAELTTYQVRDLERERGPLLRALEPVIDGCTVAGGTLETSQGATVPLRHAFRVFQFVALCRAEGKAWKPGTWGPKHIRVGHFALDSVAPSGDFAAGCHSIKWAEVERLANRLGVAGCLATLPELAEELA